MPRVPIIDSHLHLWDPANLQYPWLDNIPVLNRAFLLKDYDKATEFVSVEKMIFVQCECIASQCESEAVWVSRLAQEDQRIQGIIPLAPLEENDVIEILERYATNLLIKGIRRIIQFEPDPAFCLNPNFIRGVQLLSKFNYTFDICIHYKQLPQAINLVSKCPNVKFILDHIGKPDIKGKQFESWSKHVRELAGFANVFCKISGLVTEADHIRWTALDLKPYIDHILECFGIDRLLFGGDWPVVIQAATFKQWIDALDNILSSLNQNELRKLYSQNAVKIYRL